MVSRKHKTPPKRFAGSAKTVPRSDTLPGTGKKTAPAAHPEPHAAPAKKNSRSSSVTPLPGPASKQTQNKINRTSLPVVHKPVPLAAPSRHVWAPPQLPFARDIPSLYNETYLRMIPRGPHYIFSFWEIGGADLEKVQRTGDAGEGQGSPQPVLRLYTVGRKPGKKAGQEVRRIGDIHVPPGAHSHYVRVPESGLTYRMDLGIVTSAGTFVPVCRSNETATPCGRVGTVIEGRQNPGSWTRTGKLIDFSLLSGKMVAEADRGQPLLLIDEDDPFALEPCEDVSSPAFAAGKGSTSSWTCCSPSPQPRTPAQ
jgi:hypothetical protein